MAHFLPTLLLAASFLSIPTQARLLFPFEQRQLTKEYIASLPEEDQALFGFDSSPNLLAVNNTDIRCRYGPSDGGWPSEKAWAKLSKQLSTADALIKTTPQASVCYGAAKNDAKCQDLTKSWTDPYTHINDPTEVLSPIYQGLTCQPPTIYNSGSCTLGGYPSYVIKAADVLDIQLGINFARNDFLRLVVKNTGHDFGGKSVGAGALSIWTHGLKDIQFFDSYVDGSYRGPAVKAGAGVQAFDLYKAADAKGLVVVGGEGQTVGIMGGYIQGGGHSPLSSLYGMAADNVLGFEIVTPTGEFVTANSTSNTELFWALRGGGGGTFGVVTSVTIKAFKDLPITTATWTFDSLKLGKERFWAATKAVLDHSISYVDSGAYTYFSLAPSPSPNANSKDFSFTMHPFFLPNGSTSIINTILAPLQTQLTALNIPFSPTITEYKGFYPAWQASFPLERQSSVSAAFASRLFPRSNFASETGRNVTFAALRQTVEANASIIGFNIAPTLSRSGNPDNAVNSAWRTAILHLITSTSWPITASAAEIRAARTSFTNGTMKKLRDVTPGSGSYANEADRLEPDWQRSFWGDKYARLEKIKKNLDPKDVFWAANAVGSEGWVVESGDGLPSENGRLCKVSGSKAAVEEGGRTLRAF